MGFFKYFSRILQVDVETYNQTNKVNIKESVGSEEDQMLRRQQNILNDLDKLQHEVLSLSKKAGITEEEINNSLSTKNYTPKAPAVAATEDLDIVITAMTSKPPLSAFVLLNLLKDRGIKFSVACHVHSSLKELPSSKLKNCVDWQKCLVQPHSGTNFTFIWKEDLFGPSLIVSPKVQTAIKGDANITRFLCRKFAPDLYDSLDENSIAVQDNLMDIALSQILHGTSKDCKKAFDTLDKQVGKSNWFLNNQYTIADIVTWSAITTTKMSGSLPPNLKQWFMNCNKTFSKVSQALQ